MKQPPRAHKTCTADINFEPTEFPPLKKNQEPKPVTSPAATTTASQTTASFSMTTATPVYDYKAELKCLSYKIEIKLRKQFDDFFAQLKTKIDKLVEQNADQEKVNINVTKQLNFLVEKVTKLLCYLPPQASSNTPPPHNGEGQL